MDSAYPVSLLPNECGGLIREIANSFLSFAPYPNPVYAAAGALSLLSGIAGGYWNINGAGLNQYTLVVGETGTGKDAIAGGISRFLASLANTSERYATFRGPGELVSTAGLIKWLDRQPCALSVLGEVGYLIEAFGNPKAPPHIRSLERLALQLYSKSGFGNTLDPSAYSDKEKNTGVIHHPSWSFIGDTTGANLYPHIDIAQVASGFLPRCNLFESTAPRPPLNRSIAYAPDPVVIGKLAGIAAYALSLASSRSVQPVQTDPQAQSLLYEFEEFATSEINGGNEVTRQLWNRAFLKVLKFAALPAIARNFVNPWLWPSDVLWAINLVDHQTKHLIGKFESNEVGQVEGNQAKQRDEVIRVIKHWLTSPFGTVSTYGMSQQHHEWLCVTKSYLSKRLITLAAFKGDRIGATGALDRTIKRMLEDGELVEMPFKQAQARFADGAKVFTFPKTSLLA